MFTKAGILSVVAGLVVAVFTGISNFMEARNFWVDLTISKLLGEEAAESLVYFSDTLAIQDSLNYLVNELPFSGFLIGLGVLLLFISLFLKNH